MILVYPIWGYGIIDPYEEPFKFRKIFQFADAGMLFSWIASFMGNNYGLPFGESEESKQRSGARTDKDGNILPNHIKRYNFEDEYTYRI